MSVYLQFDWVKRLSGYMDASRIHEYTNTRHNYTWSRLDHSEVRNVYELQYLPQIWLDIVHLMINDEMGTPVVLKQCEVTMHIHHKKRGADTNKPHDIDNDSYCQIIAA